MTLWTLLLRSLRFHARSHLGALLGAAVGTAVLVGALVVGDSVRGSLRAMALQRLGRTGYAIHTHDRLFLQDLVQRLKASALARRSQARDGTGTRPEASDGEAQLTAALLLPGVVSRQDGAARANRVSVIGVEADAWPRFADWHRLPPGPAGDGKSLHPSQGASRTLVKSAETQRAPDPEMLARWRAGEVALLNEALARQLRVKEGEAIIVRLRKPSALALDAVITPREDTTAALRLKVGGVLGPQGLGDLSLAASQIPPANLFLPLDFLAEKVGVPGRANLLLHEAFAVEQEIGRRDPAPAEPERRLPRWSQFVRHFRTDTAEPDASQERLSHLAEELRRSWSLEDAELEVREVERPESTPGGAGIRPFVELVSRRVFLEEPVIEAALTPRMRWLSERPAERGHATNDPAFLHLATNGVRVLTYLVNLIQAGGRATPYSMVTAADPPYVPADLGEQEILVNEWLADDLGVKPGDTVQLSYYLADSASQLVERTNSFRVRAIVPLRGRYADRGLMPEFPGLAKAESTHEWDAGFPLVHKIRDKDEDYWKKHRGTPKAFLTLTAGQKMWSNRFGSLTAIRWEAPTRAWIGSAREAVRGNLLANLDPASVGLRFEPVRDRALAAVNQAQDFGGLFLGFSFFLIVAALLLMALLFQFGIEQRAEEVGTLLALGFTPKQTRRLLLLEGGALALGGGLLGALGGVCYARALLQGLSTVWRDAVGTSALRFHAEATTLALGACAGFAVAWLTIWLTARNQARQPARELLAEGAEERGWRLQAGAAPTPRSRWIAPLASVLAVALVAWALARGETTSAGVFFGAGTLLLVAGLAFAAGRLIALSGSESAAHLSVRALGTRNCARRRKRSLATLGLLACGSFLIAAVGANRLDGQREATRRASGTGGFALLGESALPVVADLNTAAGWEAFGLDSNALAGVSFVPFRVREGDDASCLNLNRAQKPRLLGVRPEALAERGAFTFAKVAKEAKGLAAEHPWMLLAPRTTAVSAQSGREATASSIRTSISPDMAGPTGGKARRPAAAGVDGDVIPAIGDAASIRWAMGKRLGDTLAYTDEHGRAFKVRLVAAVANSILQGNLIIDEAEFARRFPSESGYRMFLIDGPSNRADEVAATLSRALQDVGLELTPTARRLAAFNAVQNTYLDTFQLLGALGLLLGSVGLGVVVLRNVLERRSELALLLAVGFPPRAVKWLVVSEHGALLVAGLAVGVVAALVAVLPALLSPGAQWPYVSLGLSLLAVFLSGALWTWLAAAWALRGRLIEALRNE